MTGGMTLEFMEYIRHFVNSTKSFINCSAEWGIGPTGNIERVGGQCLGCNAIAEKNSGVSVSPRNAFLILHLDDYYMVPAYDSRTGEALTYKEDSDYHKKGEPILNRLNEDQIIKMAEKDKDLLTEFKDGEFEPVFGNIMYWDMPNTDRDVLHNYAARLENYCTCGGRIEVPAWLCSGCEEALYDVERDPKLTSKEVQIYQTSQVECPSCGNFDFANPFHECTKCQNPEPLTLWECSLEISKTSNDKKGVLSISGHRPVEDGDIPEELLEQIPKNHETYLTNVIVPDSIEEQMKKLKLRSNPLAQGQDGGRFRDYSGGGDGGKEESPRRGRGGSRLNRGASRARR